MEVEHKIITKEVRGVSMKFIIDNRSLDLCSRMNYEIENLDFIDCINENEIYLDLGACEGRFSIYAALKGIQVIAFEPENMNFNVLTQNISSNGLKPSQIKTFNYAVGEMDTIGTMNIGQPWAGGHQKVVKNDNLRSGLEFDFKTSQSVKVVSLDSFLEKEDLPNPNYMKIDIDGSEVAFIKGAQETLANKNLKEIIFELDKTDEQFSYILSQLEAFNFLPHSEYQVPNEPGLFNIIFKRS